MIGRELACGSFLYRYSGMEREEGAFLACSFRMVEALALLGRDEEAKCLLRQILAALPERTGIMAEMVDPHTGNHLGNTPQGLSHLGLIHAACSIAGDKARPLTGERQDGD